MMNMSLFVYLNPLLELSETSKSTFRELKNPGGSAETDPLGKKR
jgi:hypothetical protein